MTLHPPSQLNEITKAAVGALSRKQEELWNSVTKVYGPGTPKKFVKRKGLMLQNGLIVRSVTFSPSSTTFRELYTVRFS